MPELNEAVIISAARTPVGKFLGSLKGFTAPQLGSIVVREAVKRAGVKPEIWSYGHRNIQGMAFDPRTGTLWTSEQGPRCGDEINLLLPGRNYGWPLFSLGLDDGLHVDPVDPVHDLRCQVVRIILPQVQPGAKQVRHPDDARRHHQPAPEVAAGGGGLPGPRTAKPCSSTGRASISNRSCSR